MVLVLGGTGLVGSYLLMYLTEKGTAVKAAYRQKSRIKNTRRIFEAYGKLPAFEQIQWVQAEIMDISSLEDAFENVRYVYHCAALVSFDPSESQKISEINIDGTANVVNLCLDKNIKKLCYVSSVAAIGEETAGGCSNENTEWKKNDSTSNYSISKHYAENEVWRASEEGLSVVIVNPSLILGYGNWHSGSLAIIKKVSTGLSFYPPGANSFVGVRDVAKIMLQLMESSIEGERFILSSENLSYKQLLDYIAEALQKPKPSKKAPRRVGKLLASMDYLRSALFGQPRLLTRESLNTSFNKKCYSSKKLRKELKYEFEPIEEVMEESAEKFRHFPFIIG